MRTKSKLTTLVCIAALVLLPSCAMFNSTATTDQKATDIKNLSYTAASIGTAIAITDNPELQPRFELAYTNLNNLVNGKIITGLMLRDIVNSLPVEELKSPNARIAIEGATYLYTSTVGDRLNIENQPYVLAAATGIRDGIGAALGKK